MLGDGTDLDMGTQQNGAWTRLEDLDPSGVPSGGLRGLNPRWEEDLRIWSGCEAFGPEPSEWGGPVGSIPVEWGLHAYQRRNVPIVEIGRVCLLSGPRPPYFSWHGHPGRTGHPLYSLDERKVAGSGIYLAQRFQTAQRHAGLHGEVFAFYANTHRLVLLDARWERRYSEEELEGLEVTSRLPACSGWDLLFQLNRRYGGGSHLTEHLRTLGFTGIAYGSTSRGEGGWCIFDPRSFKRMLNTASWSHDEICRREAFDPDPIAADPG